MPEASPDARSALFVGEWSRTLDERYRISLPTDWAELIAGPDTDCTLAKERPGCVSVWRSEHWRRWLDDGLRLIEAKVSSGRLDQRTDQLQTLGRLLSTRHYTAQVAGRGRIAIPESFRDFLGIEPGGRLLIVGAAVCVELWNPALWGEHIAEEMPGFRDLFNQLTA
ncbi:division/cell wall cluster transcriptional repressor MraZ [Pirellulales bacterium]|nr:division/cell wall cluster transcriptional repressor MraZ [Pirellulales bacterium]